ncbi:MAG: TIGR01777 family oxidoreductase [Thermoanaerobaculia bacterium]
MRVAITGGTGLIGRALAAELWGAGHDVVVTSRSPEKVDGLPAGVTARAWDAASAQGILPLVEEADAIVHLVGESLAAGRWSAARKTRIRASRVDSTRALVAALALASSRPAVLLQASAVGIYGPRDDETVDEDSPLGAGFLANLCREWEEAGAEAEALGVRRVIARTGVVLASAGGALPRMALPFKLFAGGPLGSGRQWMSWIHLADLVAASRWLLAEPEARGAYNLTAPEPLTNRDLSSALGRSLGRPSFAPVPGFVLRLAVGEMAEILLTGQRVLPRRLLAAGYTFRFPTAAAALADLLA